MILIFDLDDTLYPEHTYVESGFSAVAKHLQLQRGWDAEDEQIEQPTILLQDNGIKPTTVYVDLGCRGVDQKNPGIQINHRGKAKRLNEKELTLLKRRQSIEPTIGHLKHDHLMDRCHLRGETGDRLHAVLCVAGYNIRWLLRMILKKGISSFLCLIFSFVVPLISAVGSCRSRVVNATGAGFRPVAA
jgi:hypothetical protein